MATTTTRFKTSHNHFPKKAQIPTAIAKPKRRRCRETTISSAAEDDDPGTVVKNLTSSLLPLPPPPRHSSAPNPNPNPNPTANSVNSPSPSSSPSTFRIRFFPGSLSPVMDFTAVNGNGNHHNETASFSSSSSSSSTFPSSFTKFNSVLTAGLLNPMSPPPPMCDKTRSSPTLFEMMASEPDVHPPRTSQIQHRNPSPNPNLNFAVQDKNAMAMQRISDALNSGIPGSLFNDASSCDIKLTLTSMDGIMVSMSVHRQILSANSRFFAVNLSDRWAKQQNSPPYVVEIADCEDVEVYIEALRLMYCKDLRKKLMKEDVPRVLGILKVSAAIGYDAGVLSCLEYLEAAPWAEEEEEKVASLLSELRLEGFGAGEVLKRVSADSSARAENNSANINNNEEVLMKLLNVVLDGKDEKARREMKLLVLKMLRENNNSNNGDPIRKESLYRASESCLSLLRRHFLRAAESSPENDDLAQIARQSDNLHWLLDIMIDRHLAADFVASWASEVELAQAHRKIPAVHRFEVSRVTARMFVGIGKGQVLAPKEVRGKLLGTWLGPFYEDFGWMRRASRGLDRHLIEDGLGNTILTLPLPLQQEILLAWFNRFLNSGEDCPNIQKGFEVWWRRSFWRRGIEPPENTPSLRIMAATIEN